MKLPRSLFIDTSFFIALVNSTDADHHRANALQAEIRSQKVRKITSEYVLIELGDGLSRLKFRSLAQKIISVVRQDSTFEIVPAATPFFEQAFTLFNDRPDKEWGLTDCSSFVIMQHLGLRAALTADQHFEQAGFQALLRVNEHA